MSHSALLLSGMQQGRSDATWLSAHLGVPPLEHSASGRREGC